MLIVAKMLIVVSVVGLLRCSATFRRMSRDLDEQVLAHLKRITHASEEGEYPPQLIPLLILLSAACFMFSAYVTTLAAR